MEQVSYILCDVEGTTTDIRFVHKELFPYAKAHLASFFVEHPEEQDQSAIVLGCTFDEVCGVLEGFIERDIKDAELKRIQGKIWAIGYAAGTLKGHVYPDVPKAFARWKEQGKQIGIYSSGSVQAQKLIYGHSVAGDLCVYIDHHFDLAQGYKYEAQSYRNIVDVLGIPARQILFLSDVEAELDAAQKVGIKTIRLFRDEQQETRHHQVQDFDAICP